MFSLSLSAPTYFPDVNGHKESELRSPLRSLLDFCPYNDNEVLHGSLSILLRLF